MLQTLEASCRCEGSHTNPPSDRSAQKYNTNTNIIVAELIPWSFQAMNIFHSRSFIISILLISYACVCKSRIANNQYYYSCTLTMPPVPQGATEMSWVDVPGEKLLEPLLNMVQSTLQLLLFFFLIINYYYLLLFIIIYYYFLLFLL